MCKDNNYTKLRFTMENDIKEVLLTPNKLLLLPRILVLKSAKTIRARTWFCFAY